MTRETIAAKAARYLAEGRVTVTRVAGDLADAIVMGDSGEHHVSHDPAGWRCTCPARVRCSHVEALKLITVSRVAAPSPEDDGDRRPCAVPFRQLCRRCGSYRHPADECPTLTDALEAA